MFAISRVLPINWWRTILPKLSLSHCIYRWSWNDMRQRLSSKKSEFLNMIWIYIKIFSANNPTTNPLTIPAIPSSRRGMANIVNTCAWLFCISKLFERGDSIERYFFVSSSGIENMWSKLGQRRFFEKRPLVPDCINAWFWDSETTCSIVIWQRQ